MIYPFSSASLHRAIQKARTAANAARRELASSDNQRRRIAERTLAHLEAEVARLEGMRATNFPTVPPIHVSPADAARRRTRKRRERRDRNRPT